MTNEQSEKLKALLADKEVAGELLQQKSEADTQAFLKEKGVDLSTEDITALHKVLDTYAGKDGSLNEDDLASVAGGASVSPFMDKVLAQLRDVHSSIVTVDI